MHECASLGIRLPGRGLYGAGLFFASRDERARTQAMALFAAIVEEEGQHLLGWRPVPTNNASVGNTALAAEPPLFPAGTIALLMLCFTFIGDGLRDALDPRQR